MEFKLTNDQPKKRLVAIQPKEHQKVLFSGMNCLPGQLDLFPTDGTEQQVGERCRSNEPAGNSRSPGLPS